MKFEERKGKSLRRGGNPSKPSDWEVCSGDPRCPRHLHDYGNQKSDPVELDKEYLNKIKSDLNIPELPEGYFFKLAFSAGGSGTVPEVYLYRKGFLGLSRKVAVRSIKVANREGFVADYLMDPATSVNLEMAEIYNKQFGKEYGLKEITPAESFNEDKYYSNHYAVEEVYEQYRAIIKILNSEKH